MPDDDPEPNHLEFPFRQKGQPIAIDSIGSFSVGKGCQSLSTYRIQRLYKNPPSKYQSILLQRKKERKKKVDRSDQIESVGLC
jgi:hypothetical protein